MESVNILTLHNGLRVDLADKGAVIIRQVGDKIIVEAGNHVTSQVESKEYLIEEMSLRRF